MDVYLLKGWREIIWMLNNYNKISISISNWHKTSQIINLAQLNLLGGCLEDISSMLKEKVFD